MKTFYEIWHNDTATRITKALYDDMMAHGMLDVESVETLPISDNDIVTISVCMSFGG